VDRPSYDRQRLRGIIAVNRDPGRAGRRTIAEIFQRSYRASNFTPEALTVLLKKKKPETAEDAEIPVTRNVDLRAVGRDPTGGATRYETALGRT